MDSSSTQSNSSHLYDVLSVIAEQFAQSEKGFFGWLIPTWREIVIECKSAMPKFLYLMWAGQHTSKDEKATTESSPSVFEQDLK